MHIATLPNGATAVGEVARYSWAGETPGCWGLRAAGSKLNGWYFVPNLGASDQCIGRYPGRYCNYLLSNHSHTRGLAL